ncbi:MAG: polysaccharide biosynthesis/export family protein [Verrucomicrobium sp.]|nr:polysaccharide biosynthesis/export family protein [Verrucomicrobium sp.]
MNRLLLLLAACLLVAACGGGFSSTGANTGTAAYQPSPAVTPEGTAQTPAAAPETDLLRVGDVLTIRLSGVPSDDAGIYEVKIGDEGDISMPYAGKFQAAGRTTSQLKEDIETAYREKKIYSTPNITIVPQLRYVNVSGEVRQPQRIPFTNDLSVLRAITACGGFTDYANKRKVKILRNGALIRFNAVEALKNPTLDIALQAGDQIQVDRGIF